MPEEIHTLANRLLLAAGMAAQEAAPSDASFVQSFSLLLAAVWSAQGHLTQEQFLEMAVDIWNDVHAN